MRHSRARTAHRARAPIPAPHAARLPWRRSDRGGVRSGRPPNEPNRWVQNALAMTDPPRHEKRVAGIVARIRQIPKGSVRTYGEIDPEAPRLVGRVLATTHEDLPWQ